MSRDTLINQGKLIYENILGLDRATLLNDPGNLQPWNGLVFSDFVESFEEMSKLLNGIYETKFYQKRHLTY